ncbi:DUF4190 domain-containing protein [uncultured Brevibacterium sp.]|uniref:DUF4190 domain-containing protein n=1 Tax=uncultured Brevibacterium sp. TaxID=189678 RepID=UPI0025FA0AA5|nr:DUF4190 domain-containing protein [uncultured Brevibacterium sp.]
MSSNTPGSSGGSSRPYNDLPSYDSGPSSSGQGPASFKPGASHGSGGSAYGSATPGAASSGSPAYGSSSYGSSPSDYGSSQSSTYGGGDYSSGNYGASANEPANPTPAYNPTPTYNAQPAPYGAPGYPMRRPTNGLAIAALIVGIISLVSTWPFGIIGIAPAIMGHIALKQCKERDQEGKGLAIGGLVTGYIAVAGFVVIVLFFIFVIGLTSLSSS